MTTPLLEDALLPSSPSMPPGPSGAVRHFRVRRGGTFCGQAFVEGDVLVIGDRSREGWPVVLVARGLGRPRLGTQRGTHLMGEGGEPCHPSRWLAAGRVLGVVRDASQSALGLVHTFTVDDWHEQTSVAPPARRVAVAKAQQLSLFAA